MNPEDLQPASFRNIVFLVSTSGIAGGRKNARKSFVSSDLQLIEDLGLRQREFTLSGVIAARRSNDGTVEITSYRDARNTLLAALEEEGPGVLIHPFFGRIENLSVINYNLNESMSSLGDASIDITFAVSNTDGLPLAQPSVLAGVVEKAADSLAASNTTITDSFEVTTSFTGNFAAALDKLQEFVDLLRDVTNVSSIVETKLDPYNKLVSQFEDNLSTLVSTPATLADDSIELVEDTNALYTTKRETFDTYVRMFTFGDSDTPINPTTAGLVERKGNNDHYNASVQTMALSKAYENAVQLTFNTDEDIDAVAATLEDQYQKIVTASNLSDKEEEALAALRIEATSFFNAQRVTKPQIIEVRTNATSSRLIAYQYYGSSDLGDAIANLNGLPDPAFLRGDVRILST